MSEYFTFVKQNPRNVLYKIDSLDVITNGNIAGLPWPEDIWGLSLILPEKVASLDKILALKLIDYTGSVELEVKRKELKHIKADKGNSQIKMLPVKNRKELHSLFIQTYAEFFWLRWPEYVDHISLKLIANYVEKTLPGSKAVKFIKSQSLVGILNYIVKKDENSEDIDWVAWIWIDETLPRSERKLIHQDMCDVMRKLKAERLRCSVGIYNLRSQRFFEKLGFSPVVLHILKKNKFMPVS